MRGEISGGWSETWLEIWQPLTETEGVPADVFRELYRELTNSFAVVPDTSGQDHWMRTRNSKP